MNNKYVCDKKYICRWKVNGDKITNINSEYIVDMW